jgi:MFS family permease
MPMEYCTSAERPTYFAVSNSLLSPLLLSGVVGGALATVIGYQGLFWISGGLGIILILAARRLRDPRSLPDFSLS